MLLFSKNMERITTKSDVKRHSRDENCHRSPIIFLLYQWSYTVAKDIDIEAVKIYKRWAEKNRRVHGCQDEDF
jgi:hypothetical protein